MTQTYSNTPPLLAARDLVFGRDRPLSAPLSFNVARGEILALLGMNGRGKTTLLDTLAGILPPVSGTVERAARVGCVPQKFATALAYTVFDIVLMGRARDVGVFELPKREDERAAMAALDRLGIAELAPRPFSALSGGQQQLVVIARALAGGSELLLLDEPTAALDLRRQEAVMTLLQGLAAEGVGIVFSTHDPMHAGLIADKAVVLLPEGRDSVGPAADVLTPELLERAFGVAIDAVPGRPGESARLVPDFHLGRRPS